MTKKDIYFTTEEKKIEAANKLSDEDIEQLRFFKSELDAILESKTISLQNTQKLDNLVTQLLTMRSRHSFSIMSWLRQKYIIDS
tara:strand:- start:450 stop:701 length:252 start_codon:yes stop_codon:yes gene_type:complete